MGKLGICTQVGGVVGGIWAFFDFLEMFCISSVDWTILKSYTLRKNTLAILFLVGTSLSQNPETLLVLCFRLWMRSPKLVTTPATLPETGRSDDRTVMWYGRYIQCIMVILVGCSLHPVILFSHFSVLALLDVDQLIATITTTIRNNVNKNK